MRDFRGDGREAKAGDSDYRVDWKGERDMRTERKESRDHRGGESRGEGREGRRGGEGRESSRGGGLSESRGLKSDDIRMSMQEAGEVRESWGSRSFLKHHVEEEGEIGEFTDDAVAESTRVESRKRGDTRDERDREEPRFMSSRDKIERRGDLQVHISFQSSSAQRESLREEKEKERERFEKEKEKEKEKDRMKDKERHKEESAKEKPSGKEAEVDSWKDSESFRRQGNTDQEDKDHNVSERTEKQRSTVTAEFDEATVETSAVRDAEDTNKDSLDAEVKETKELEKNKMDLGEEDKGKRKIRDSDRDREDTNADAEDYEREAVSSYGIQRKRMLRPRGHYQAASREVRPRFRAKDPEAYSSRTAETCTLLYRVGEGLQEEMRKIRKDYEGRLPTMGSDMQSVHSAPTIEVRIPAELATTSNRQVQGSQLWGTDVYTDDSDLVAVLMHTGYYIPNANSPPSSILEIRVTIRILPPQENYHSTLRNNLRSRAWGAAGGCSYSADHCHLLKKDGGKIQLEPRLIFTPVYAPTLAPAVTERTVTTRAVSMSSYRQQRFVQEVTIQYNLCNEPWLKYNMNIVADKGLKKSQYTSARIKKGDVLYVETHSNRYELSYEEPKSSGAIIPAISEKGKEKAEGTEKPPPQTFSCSHGEKNHQTQIVPVSDKASASTPGEKFRWTHCKWPLPLVAMRAKGVPLPPDCIKVLESGLGWEEVLWSPAGVCVRGKEYPLARAQFVSRNS
ncbi:hypothetical protein MPTK1_3g12140 [Marchantia polymorpha subsp. ruderalis]|uniref:Histone deacetylation protein Rxt3 n=2 Tax=Marchantia polymorpha TaxID=3197 RepID=A0AAF6AZZ1_MARPO|nr:hypothetical protein MARPO_0050s0019 [Marchantia polymorpha]BBN05325.1 hypothetical protein Mp_3g12140 [Marchantia polymorpha subsp. ruderalis]|eukprot:PTQ38546.1 hypothetical protein MARPO_0050s0019 [Marchantia polymorpha]